MPNTVETMATLFDALPADATLFADGGSRGNPGPAASGAVLVGPDGAVLDEVGRYLGIATNNVAEWTALCIGLEPPPNTESAAWRYAWTPSSSSSRCAANTG